MTGDLWKAFKLGMRMIALVLEYRFGLHRRERQMDHRDDVRLEYANRCRNRFAPGAACARDPDRPPNPPNQKTPGQLIHVRFSCSPFSPCP